MLLATVSGRISSRRVRSKLILHDLRHYYEREIGSHRHRSSAKKQLAPARARLAAGNQPPRQSFNGMTWRVDAKIRPEGAKMFFTFAADGTAKSPGIARDAALWNAMGIDHGSIS